MFTSDFFPTVKKSLFLLALTAISSFTCGAQRIAVLSDIHVSPGSRSDSVLRVAVDEINALPCDLVVVSGDLTYEGLNSELVNVKSILDRISHPLALVPGNHENNWSQSAARDFIRLWGDDKFVVDLDSLVVVGLNCGPFLKMGDGFVRPEDLKWLETTLAEKASGGKRVLSVNHYPLLDDLDNWQQYLDILQRYAVVGHINGHHHSWKQYRSGDIDTAMVRALMMKDGTSGYSLVNVTADSVSVFEKVIGREPQLKYSWPVTTVHKPADFEAFVEPQSPEGFTISKIWTDSAAVFTRVSADCDNIYFGNSLGQITALDKDRLQVSWQVPVTESLFSRPVVLRRGLIAAPCEDGILIIDNGNVVARHPSASGPYVADGLCADSIYVHGAFRRFERRDPDDGRLIWSYDSVFNYCQAAPAVDGDNVVFGAWDSYLRCLSLRDGSLRWIWNSGINSNFYSPGNVVPVITNGRVYVVTPDNRLTAIELSSGRQLWRDKSHRYRESIGVSADGSRVYAKTMDGEMVAVDAAAPDYRELWTIDMAMGYEFAPSLVVERDGIVYAGSRRGQLAAIDARAQRLLWTVKLGISQINGIDIDPCSPDIYVSLVEGIIYRISPRR